MAHNHHSPGHQHGHGNDQALLHGMLITILFAAVEAVGGWWSGSLTLLGDAGHMVSDGTALGLAAFAARVARQPASAQHSYGLVRAEAVAALVNGLFMLLVVAGIAYHAIERLRSPHAVAGGTVMIIAFLGLLINLLVAKMLHGGEQTLNTRGALLHVLGDLLGSVAAMLAGLVIYFTGWMPIDPLLSLLICGLILFSSLRLLRDVLNVIMEGVPRGLELPEVGQAMAGVSGVSSVHDLHIWTLSSGMVVLSAHVVIQDMNHWERILDASRRLLSERFSIDHVTLQPEPTTTITAPIRLHISEKRPFRHSAD